MPDRVGLSDRSGRSSEVPFEAETWGTPIECEPEHIPEIPPDLRVPPPGWDHDLWFQFRSGVAYEETVPRDCDGEPLFDGDGIPRRPRYV